MDLLSKFLLLHPVSTNLDWRCELKTPWKLVNEGTQFGIAPFHLITEGDAWLDISGEEIISLEVGDILMLPHGTPHVLHCGNKEAPLPEVLPSRVTKKGLLKRKGSGPQAEVLCGEFIFDPLISNMFIKSLPKVVLLRTRNHAIHWHLYQVLQILNIETKNEVPGAQVIAEHLSSALFSLLIRGWILENNTNSNILLLMTEPRLYPAIHHLLNKPEQALTLAELADLCHMSRATFIRIFKRKAGHSPVQLMDSIRMSHAIKLLSKPGTRLSNVAESIGYSSEPAFQRAFKKYFGMPPGSYRVNNLLMFG